MSPFQLGYTAYTHRSGVYNLPEHHVDYPEWWQGWLAANREYDRKNPDPPPNKQKGEWRHSGTDYGVLRYIVEDS